MAPHSCIACTLLPPEGLALLKAVRRYGATARRPSPHVRSLRVTPCLPMRPLMDQFLTTACGGCNTVCTRQVPEHSGWGGDVTRLTHTITAKSPVRQKIRQKWAQCPPQMDWRCGCKRAAKPRLRGKCAINVKPKSVIMPRTAPGPVERFRKIPELSAERK